MGNESNIIELKCSNCGGQIQVPAHSNGKVKCPWCDTESFIEGLVKNTEILNKDNINSGVPMTLDKATLNARIIASLTTPLATFPLDILEKCTIIEQKHICVPAYLFYCNGTASYTYETGVSRQRSVPKEVDGKIQYESQTYTEWYPMSGTATTSGHVIVSGNRQYYKIINELYKNYTPSKLVDIESVEFPEDVQTLTFDYPQPAAFNDYVSPRMQEMLKASATKSLQQKSYRSFELGGCNIQKNEVLRLWLGVYRVSIKYNDETYVLFISGDGSSYCWSKQPVDEARRKIYQEKQAAEKEQAKSTYLILAIVFGIFGLLTFGITFIPAGIFGYLHYKRCNEHKITQDELNAINAAGQRARQQFQQTGRFLEGL